jgi:dolichol-phosphate mannosyltransferase
MRVSIVVPIYNESENIRPLADELNQLADTMELEILIVDDGSTDDTWHQIEAAAGTCAVIRPVRIPVNRGQSNAMLRGMHMATGEVIVFMDGDLQNDPTDIPTLVDCLESCDVVCGYRAKRRDSWSRRVGSRIANVVRNWVTHDDIRDTGCSLKAFKAAFRNDIPHLDGAHRFLAAYFHLHGRIICEVPVNHRPRRYGTSKYTNLKRLPRTVADLFGFHWYRKRLLHSVMESSTVEP